MLFFFFNDTATTEIYTLSLHDALPIFPQPPAGQVRIRVQACGICLSDHLVKDGLWPGVTYPRSPGHEVAGTIDEVGAGVTIWKKGQRVGIGWHGGHDGTCLQCRRGDFINCANEKITGFSFDGGYAEYTVVPAEALAAMPDSLDPAEAAPLLCAGITTFNALRHSGARPGDLVAVQGIGGVRPHGILLVTHLGSILAAIPASAAETASAHNTVQASSSRPSAPVAP